MADFTKTVSNGLRLFGPSPTNNWGTMLWGQNWAYGDVDFITAIAKTLSNSFVLSNTVSLQANFFPTISNSISVSGDLIMEGLIDSNGYNYFFPDENGENRPNTSYNMIVDTATSFTTLTNTQTVWNSL